MDTYFLTDPMKWDYAQVSFTLPCIEILALTAENVGCTLGEQ